jgi:D-aspartate ligase
MPTYPPNFDLIRGEEDLKDRLQPVVCGADILGYTYVRCYQDAYGIRPLVLSSIDVKITSSSKLCDYRVVPGLNSEEGLISTLLDLGRQLAAEGKVPILHGSADWNTRMISLHKAELEQWYVVPYIDFALLDEITQKRRFYEICEELGIAYPKTWYIPCPTEHEPLDTSAFPYPLIAKPSNSAAWDDIEFPGKKKIYEIETPEELTQAFEAVCASPYEHDLIVQDFVPGDDDAIRSLTTFSDAEGRLRVVSGGRVALQDHSPLALGNPVCILGEKVDKIIEDASRFLEHVGYRGYANFDIKFDSRDGSYRFFEVNTRPGKNTFYVTLGGVNYVKPIVEEYVLRREVARVDAYKPFLYTVVPPKVVRKSVKDDALRADVLAAYRDGRATNPLGNPRDGLMHKLWVALYTQNQVRKFKRYLWDTGGKQANVD